jgi:hypothetical protein
VIKEKEPRRERLTVSGDYYQAASLCVSTLHTHTCMEVWVGTRGCDGWIREDTTGCCRQFPAIPPELSGDFLQEHRTDGGMKLPD